MKPVALPMIADSRASFEPSANAATIAAFCLCFSANSFCVSGFL
jgi:hypothetical protein